MYTEADFDTLYSDIRKALSSDVNIGTVTIVTKLGMQMVQTNARWSIMKGGEKKELVVAVVTAVVKDAIQHSSMPKDKTDAIIAALELAPFFIDAAVDFAKTYQTAPPADGSVPVKRKCFSFC